MVASEAFLGEIFAKKGGIREGKKEGEKGKGKYREDKGEEKKKQKRKRGKRRRIGKGRKKKWRTRVPPSPFFLSSLSFSSPLQG